MLPKFNTQQRNTLETWAKSLLKGEGQRLWQAGLLRISPGSKTQRPQPFMELFLPGWVGIKHQVLEELLSCFGEVESEGRQDKWKRANYTDTETKHSFILQDKATCIFFPHPFLHGHLAETNKQKSVHKLSWWSLQTSRTREKTAI